MSFETNPNLSIGSAWERQNGSISVVIAVTNLSLREELQEKFPPQVVFVTGSGTVLSQEIQIFLKSRKFVGTDAFVQEHVTKAIEGADEEQDTEDEEPVDIDSIDPDTFDGIVNADNDEGEGEGAEEEEGTIPVFEPAVFDGLALDDHFISYAEAPAANGDTLHILRFALDETLNLDQVCSVFDVTSELSPALESFVVDSEAERTNVNIGGYLPVFLEVDSEGNAVAAVYLTSVGDFRAAQAAAELEAALLDAGVTEAVVKSVSADTEENTPEITVIPQVVVQPAAVQVTN